MKKKYSNRFHKVVDTTKTENHEMNLYIKQVSKLN